jgi:hypothetical protein
MTTNMTSSTLADAINSLPSSGELPLPLPPVHLTTARYFTKIVANGFLSPQNCKYFGEPILYLFYGGVFYRPESSPTRHAIEFPVAFVFNPSVLDSVERFFPFDTGAIKSGRVGGWTDRLKPIDPRFKVDGRRESVAPEMVQYLFGSNANYLRGKINSDSVNKPDPFPLLHEYYSDDLTSLGVDHRQCVIECQCLIDILLTRDLIWVGFPETMTDEFAKLYLLTKPYMPDYYAYDCPVIFNPSEIAAILADKAKEVIYRYVVLPGGD